MLLAAARIAASITARYACCCSTYNWDGKSNM
jgi:hypothetical protein